MIIFDSQLFYFRWLVQSMIRIFIGDVLNSSKESTAEIADQV